MKTTGWIFLILGIISFIGAALKGHSVFGPLFWSGLGITLLYYAENKKEKEASFLTNANPGNGSSYQVAKQQLSQSQYVHSTAQKVKSYWETYKENNPQKALDLENLYGTSFSRLNEDDIKERIESVERAAKSQECAISELKANLHAFFDRIVPEMGAEDTRKMFLQIQQMDKDQANIRKENSFSTLCIKWFDKYVEERERRMPPEEQFREQVRITFRKRVEVNDDMGDPYLNGMQAYIAINNLYSSMKEVESLKAMDMLLRQRGFSAYDILEQECNKALEIFCGMDMSKVDKNEAVDDTDDVWL